MTKNTDFIAGRRELHCVLFFLNHSPRTQHVHFSAWINMDKINMTDNMKNHEEKNGYWLTVGGVITEEW